MAHRAGRPARARRPHRRRRAAVHRARHRRAARRRGDDRRVGVVPVRVRPAALRRALRQGPHRPPRRQAGALAAAHRHDRRHAARGRGRRSTTAEPNTWRVAPGADPGRATGPSSPTCPTPRSSSPRRRSPAGEVTVPAGPRHRPSPAPRSWPCWPQAGATVGRRGRDDRHAAPTPSTASTSTCTTPASSPRPSPRSPRWPRARRGSAEWRTSAATRPTGSPRSPRRSTRSAATSSRPPDGLEIRPAALHGGPWQAYADHRMATAGALIGLVVPGVEVDDVDCTAKTMPDFPRAGRICLGRA